MLAHVDLASKKHNMRPAVTGITNTVFALRCHHACCCCHCVTAANSQLENERKALLRAAELDKAAAAELEGGGTCTMCDHALFSVLVVHRPCDLPCVYWTALGRNCGSTGLAAVACMITVTWLTMECMCRSDVSTQPATGDVSSTKSKGHA
jgi:hypothetical protein